MISKIDPFLLQLVIVPIITIGAGIIGTLLTRKKYIGPLITTILILAFEFFVMGTFSSWNIILPIVSLVVSRVILEIKFKS